MTAALASAANTVDLPAERGVSPRAARAVLRAYARIAQGDGTFKYGLRGSKVATLTDYSLSSVRRVQRYLLKHGFIERVKVGGGRAATVWRVVLERLGIRHGSDPAVTPQPSRRDTAQDRTQGLFSRMFSGDRRERDHAAVTHPPGRDSEPPPSRAAVAATRSGDPADAALAWAETAADPASTCEHGGRAGYMASGAPWCPSCRRKSRWRRA